MGLLPLLIGVAVSFVINTIGWAVSSAAETDLFYDLLGAAAHIATVLFSWLSSDYKDSRNVVASALVALWASRLGIFLFTRAVSNGGDRRLEKYKHDPVKFSVLWFVQFLWVVFNTLPLLTINAWSKGSPMGLTDFVGIVVFFVGFMIELVADEQKRKFAVNKQNRGKFIDSGLWKYSRHPNYFGEILLWSGLTLLCAGGVNMFSAQILVLLAPGFEVFLLLKVSGIPLLEKSGKQRWGEDPRYRHYVDVTNVLVPWFPVEKRRSARSS